MNLIASCQRTILGRARVSKVNRNLGASAKMSDETGRYIEDYCIHRLREENINLVRYQHVSIEPNSPVSARIRLVGKEIEESDPEFFSQCCQQLNPRPTTVYAQFNDLANELFRGAANGVERGISWGRIAALVAFSGRLALFCATHNMEDFVPSVIGWTTRYINTNIYDWIRTNGGWRGFLEYFDEERAAERSKEAIKELFGTIGKVALMGAGVAMLYSFFKR